MFTRQGLAILDTAVSGYDLQGRTLIYFTRQGLANISRQALAIHEKVGPGYGFQGKTLLYLTR